MSRLRRRAETEARQRGQVNARWNVRTARLFKLACFGRGRNAVSVLWADVVSLLLMKPMPWRKALSTRYDGSRSSRTRTGGMFESACQEVRSRAPLRRRRARIY